MGRRLLLLFASAAVAASSPCHDAMVRYCNSTASRGAPCVACEQAHKADLLAAGCGWRPDDPASKLEDFYAASRKLIEMGKTNITVTAVA